MLEICHVFFGIFRWKFVMILKAIDFGFQTLSHETELAKSVTIFLRRSRFDQQELINSHKSNHKLSQVQPK